MSPEEIRDEISKEQQNIEKSTERIRELRKVCKHEDSKSGLYSYRVGNISDVKMCLYCDEVLEYL